MLSIKSKFEQNPAFVNTKNTLVRHPAPHATESLPGYVIRLTEANGYKSPQDIYRLAGMTRDERSASSFSAAKLAAVANQPSKNLVRLCFGKTNDGAPTLRLLGNPISRSDLNLTGARVCPACVADRGYIEAHWHIEMMVACPVHRQPAIWYCGNCRHRLSWNRPGLLICRCGVQLSQVPRAVYSPSELWLLNFIRCKALAVSLGNTSEGSMHALQASSLNLQMTLSIVRYLGRQKLMNYRSTVPAMGRNLLQAAANVLEDWPVNFQKLLRDIDPRAENADDIDPVISNFEAVHGPIQKRILARMQRRT